MLLTALSVGVGVGLGVNKWISGSVEGGIPAAQIEHELFRLIVDGKDEKDTFKDFPYYLSERTQWLLTSAAYVHLKDLDVSKHTRNLSPASRSISLSGPAEFYHQKLAKALSHEFETKLLVLDIVGFSAKMQSKYATSNSFVKSSIPDMALKRMSRFLTTKEDGSGDSSKQRSGSSTKSCDSSTKPRGNIITNHPPKIQRDALVSFDTKNASVSSDTNLASVKSVINYPFDEKVFFQELYKVLVSFSETNGIILYIKDAEWFLQSPQTYELFDKMLKRLSRSILVLGSRSLGGGKVSEKIGCLFPYNIEIKPPEDESRLKDWKAQVKKHMKDIQFQDNRNHIAEVLEENDLECDDLGSICHADTLFIRKYIQEVVLLAISHHLMSCKELDYRSGKLVISSTSLSHGLSIFKEDSRGGKDTLKPETKAGSSKRLEGEENAASKSDNKNETEKSVPSKPEVPDNDFEKRIRTEVIPANEIGVTFADIGGLDEIKQSLQELVMIPLKRPDLFNAGLLKPCRGILLIGPPGTGKTMLAKAIANEAGASFINVSMSAIISKDYGDEIKMVKALFTLAAKVSPSMIYVDEVDSMIGKKTIKRSNTMWRVKNEFMTHWDGLLTKPGERIFVLAATNRPFDLDEDIIRRFERRVMVGLPSVESREMILKKLLANEKVEELDFKELAVMTDGYSGSDLKNLCVTAAYRPVRELMQQENQKNIDKKKSDEAQSDTKEESGSVIKLRPLNMKDMRQAKDRVAASFAGDGYVMDKLKQWNESFGKGGSLQFEEVPDNEYEKRIRAEVIPANEISVTFADIGALDEIKESLQELVMLPLKRPELFNGGLLKPCRGILLFGPPGTGKTMLAKAIANEAGASFINVSMSALLSKWSGEKEKMVKALFTLAAKVSPSIIFVDEVDSMLGRRTSDGEHESMRRLKNEFMSHWDGLLTKPGERILVLAATNRPFDLDDAIIRRFERRVMVGLPSVENREAILKTLLAKENVEGLDLKELAVMTDGYSGSDLKNLCVTAAYAPVRELMQQEKQNDIDKKASDEAQGETNEESKGTIKLRPLNMEDMRQATNQVAASFAGEGHVMGELKQWNELFGEGGSRKKEQPSYYL